jgi:hypothetical protein
MVESSFLTPVEEAYLNNTRPFTNAQQRYIRCRLRKKLITMGQEIERCNVQLMLYDNFERNEIVDRRRFELLSPSSTGIELILYLRSMWRIERSGGRLAWTRFMTS